MTLMRPIQLQLGLREGVNNFETSRLFGTISSNGRAHVSVKLFMLDTTLHNLKRPRKTELEQSMEGHIPARAVGGKISEQMRRHHGKDISGPCTHMSLQSTAIDVVVST
jgi:hypothetical protein